MSASPVNPGDILVGRYRVDRVLGMGNMGIVVAASHLHLGQQVALKFMLATRNTSPSHCERFLREARAAAALKTEHIARVSEFGYLENGAPYMVMEYLQGGDLAAVLQQRGPLPIAEAVDYILQACEAVGEAHSLGIIHRDIKPANLFLTVVGKRPCIKVLDFGISKLPGEEHALTKTGEAMGSPLYMSCEQMNSSKDVDGRTDIWSLSVTLYELIAGNGNTPFNADTLPKLCTRVCLDAPTPVTRYRADAPSGLEAVLSHAVEKERDRRFPNVAEFAAALAPFGSSRAAMYVERVAQALGEAVAPARPTDLLPADPSNLLPRTAVVGAAPMLPGVAATASVQGAATTGSALIRPASPAPSPWLAAGIAVAVSTVALAMVGVVRWRITKDPTVVAGTAAVATVTQSSPTISQVSPAPGSADAGPPDTPAPTVPATIASAAATSRVPTRPPVTKINAGTAPRATPPQTNVYER